MRTHCVRLIGHTVTSLLLQGQSIIGVRAVANGTPSHESVFQLTSPVPLAMANASVAGGGALGLQLQQSVQLVQSRQQQAMMGVPLLAAQPASAAWQQRASNS